MSKGQKISYSSTKLVLTSPKPKVPIKEKFCKGKNMTKTYWSRTLSEVASLRCHTKWKTTRWENGSLLGWQPTFIQPQHHMRLAVRVIGLADQQSDLTEGAGPSKKIALDAGGNFSKAAQGFVRGKGLTSWWHRIPWSQGRVRLCRNTKLENQLKFCGFRVLASLTPVMLNNNTFEYIRWIHTWSFFWATSTRPWFLGY